MATDSKAILESIFRLDHGVDLSQKQRTELYNAMSPRGLIASFYQTFSTESGEEYIWMESLQETFLLLKGNNKRLEEVAAVIIEHFKRELKDNPLWQDSGTELLPVLPILLECPAFDEPDKEWGRNIIDLMAFTMIKIKTEAERSFDKMVTWWKSDFDLLARVVKVFLQAFKSQNKKNGYMKVEENYLGILAMLYETNKSLGFKIGVDQFYLGQVEDAETVRKLGDGLLQRHLVNLSILPVWRKRSLLDFPFLFDVPTKWKLASGNFDHMQFSQLQIQQIIRNIGAIGPGPPLVPMTQQVRLRFAIDDESEKTVESAISNVSGKTEESLLLPLEVHFKSDVSLGVNAGGPMKEFFSRLFEELFDLEKHSIFQKVNDSPSCTTFWFNKDYKDLEKLKLIGKLFTLMFYNKAIITLPFPLLFYKKLLEKSKSSFEDLQLLHPTMAKSMEDLQGMSEDELSDYTFTVPGSNNEPDIELKPGGKDQVVVAANVQEFLELYAKHYTASSHFDVFSESFRSMLGRFALHKLFTPQELMSLFQGGEYDWKSFQQSFGYEKGYTAKHSVIKMFWSVFNGDLSESEKKDFLRLITGADHVPLGGFREIGPRIWPMGGDKDCRGKPPQDMCPEVNTCHGYVVLHLPMYRKREHLKERLLKLLEMKGHGFHKPVEQ